MVGLIQRRRGRREERSSMNEHSSFYARYRRRSSIGSLRIGRSASEEGCDAGGQKLA